MVFAPVGEKARWVVVFEMLKGKNPEFVLTYEAMADTLGLSLPDDLHLIQMAVRRAGKELLISKYRALENVRGVGYRVVTAGEHHRLSGSKQKASYQRNVEAYELVKYTRQDELESDVERARNNASIQALSFLLENQIQLNIEHRNLASIVAKKSKLTDDQIAKQEEKFAELEKMTQERLAKMQETIDKL